MNKKAVLCEGARVQPRYCDLSCKEDFVPMSGAPWLPSQHPTPPTRTCGFPTSHSLSPVLWVLTQKPGWSTHAPYSGFHNP